MAAGSRREDATALPVGGLYVFVTAGLAYYTAVQNNGKGSAARQAAAMAALKALSAIDVRDTDCVIYSKPKDDYIPADTKVMDALATYFGGKKDDLRAIPGSKLSTGSTLMAFASTVTAHYAKAGRLNEKTNRLARREYLLGKRGDSKANHVRTVVHQFLKKPTSFRTGLGSPAKKAYTLLVGMLAFCGPSLKPAEREALTTAVAALGDLTDDRRIADANAALPPGLPVFGGTFTRIKSCLTELAPD